MRVFKLINVLVMSAVSISVLTGCAKNEKELDVLNLADRLKNEITYEDELSITEEDLLFRLYSINPEDLSTYKAYHGTGATAEEILAAQAVDAEAAGRIKEAVEERIAEQIESFENYVPKEVGKLEQAVVCTEGRYVVLCVSNDSEKAKKIIEN